MPLSKEKWNEFQKGFKQATGVKEEEEKKPKPLKASDTLAPKMSVVAKLLGRDPKKRGY